MTKINSYVLTAELWRARSGAFSPRSAFPGTTVPGAGCGTGPSVVMRPVARVRDQISLAFPVPRAAVTAQLGQLNNYNHTTSVFVVGEGTSGPPPYREPA